MVLLMGAIGQGKTALATRLALNMAEQARLHALRAEFTDGGVAQGLRGAIERLMGAFGEGAGRVEAKLRELLRQQGEPGQEELAAWMALMRPGAAGSGAEGQDALPAQVSLFLRFVRRMSAQRPVLLVLDDVDHAGREGAALLEAIQREIEYEGLALFTLATASDDRFASALCGRPRLAASVQRIVLAPLPTEVIADGLVAAYPVSMETGRRIAVRACGTPYFARLAGGGDRERGGSSLRVGRVARRKSPRAVAAARRGSARRPARGAAERDGAGPS